MAAFHIAAFYQFAAIADPAAVRQKLNHIGAELGISGTIILAGEGVNGTVAGREGDLADFLRALKELISIDRLTVKFSIAELPPFKRFKIKIKPEIVTLKAGQVDPTTITGTYVAPKDWNALISNPEILLLDTRNDFEVRMGQFQGAVNPGMAYFREFPDYVARELDPQRHQRVAMYCTGGIRCEKASAFLLQRGFKEVYQLDGGILNYLEQTGSTENNLWQGDCFVFDDRIAVTSELKPSEKVYPPRPGREP